MNPSILVVVNSVLIAVAVVGCRPSASPSQRPAVDTATSLPVVSNTELESLVQRSDRPLLVEFGVNFGCFRCDQMKPEMNRLARRFEGRADVVRVDFNANRELAMQYGATICPSYVVVDQQRVVSTHSFPTTADLLAVDLESVVAREGDGL